MTQAGTFDIVTVVFRREVELLALQAASLDRFFPEDLVRRIFIVLNDVDEAACRARIEAMLPAYGRHAGKVEIVHPADLFLLRPVTMAERGVAGRAAGWFTRHRHLWPFGRKGGWRGNRGWSVQQALKLAIGRAAVAPYVLILDTKNHLVRPVSAASFIGTGGRPRSTLACPDAKQQIWIEASFRRMGMMPPGPENPAPPSITPVCIRTKVLRDAVEAIERRIGPVETFFARKRTRETEFMLLYAHVVGRYGSWSAAFDGGLAPPATIFRSTSDAKIVELLDCIERGEADFLAIHGSRIGKLNPGIQARLERIWQQRGLPMLAKEGATSR